MRRSWLIGAFALLVPLYVIAVKILSVEQAAWKVTENPLYVLPAPVMKIAALEYDGVAADFLFIEGLTYMGAQLRHQRVDGRINMSESQWRWFAGVLKASSDMDPCFQDPYYIANGFLAWEAGMVEEANALLEKGTRCRTWDWTLPFFLGFNYFYFLQDNDKAAEYLMVASRRPGATPTLASLASRLAFKARKTENSIVFLEEIIKRTENEYHKKLYQERLKMFKIIYALETAVCEYQKRFKWKPGSLEDLVRKNIIKGIPADPYGGTFYLDARGNIKTTNEAQLMPFQRKK